ncbi:MAG: AbrB/MazE/SpoVT family DNA-binding domain-containing protein [Acidimicrobiales bacterium]|jgi:AbrB family looped-hinge helix DNA binding protein|nr:AbrB/MazE/SpoVT family DNA-binding domain-containing protein [Actinomycetota bacterium]
MKTVTVSSSGRLTLPTEVRRLIGLEGETEMEVEVDEASDAVILRPAVLLRREDAWAYTPEHRDLLARAHRDSREGRVRELGEGDLEALGG